MLGTPELFWPKQVNAVTPAPFWSNLRCMELYYHILDPALHYLPARYTPREDARPMQNRYTADQNKMDDFYFALAKAVTNMPRLEHLHTQALTYWDGQLAPFHFFRFDVDGRFARATWGGAPPFLPSMEVVKAWRKMAYERCLFLILASEPIQ
ncbi:hypothetical protein F4825DRAFT_421554 [Nemania diffusa]|nr:hypothetical protein F4825DRAFT_421554 [Nemania diffusa]